MAPGSWPTAAATATPADRCGLGRAAAPRAPRSKTPMNGPEPRKQSLKTEVTGPRGPETGLALRPSPHTEEVTAGRAASGGLPTRQVVAEDGPHPSRELVADADTSESPRRLGCWQSSAGIGGPRSPPHQSPPADCRAGWLVQLLGLQRPHVGG